MNPKFSIPLLALLLCTSTLAQDSLQPKPIIVKKGNCMFDITRYGYVDITQYVVRNGLDTLRVTVVGDSLVRSGDTLIVRPWYVSEERFVSDSKPRRTTHDYSELTRYRVKIPIKELDRIKVKRQPFSFIMSAIATVSYIGAFTTLIAIPPDSDEQIDRRTNLAMGCFYVFVPTFTARLAFGAKRMRFDETRTRRKTWHF